MSGAGTIGSVHEALVARVRELFDGRLVDVGPQGLKGRVTVYDGVADARPAYPYVIVGGASSETPYHTLGAATAPSVGAFVRVPVRIVTQYPTSEGQTHRVLNMLRVGLDRQTLTVEGFPTAAVTFDGATLLSDMTGGVVTRELVAPVEVFVHQS